MSTYSEKLKSPLWQKKRLEVLNRAEWICQLCGDGSSQLQVHHPKYVSGKEPWEYDNLISLCETCHGNVHKKTFASRSAAPTAFTPRPSRSAGDDLVALLYCAPHIRRRVLSRLDRDWIAAAPKSMAAYWLMEFIKENEIGELDAANSFQALRESEYLARLLEEFPKDFSAADQHAEKIAIEAIRQIRGFALLKRVTELEKSLAGLNLTAEQSIEALKRRDALSRENMSPISI